MPYRPSRNRDFPRSPVAEMQHYASIFAASDDRLRDEREELSLRRHHIAPSHRERVESGLLDEIRRVVGVDQAARCYHLIVSELARQGCRAFPATAHAGGVHEQQGLLLREVFPAFDPAGGQLAPRTENKSSRGAPEARLYYGSPCSRVPPIRIVKRPLHSACQNRDEG